MKKILVLSCVVVLGLCLYACEAFCNNRAYDDDIGIAVSPQTLILGMDQGGAVTVHTNIAYSSVDTSSLELNGIPASAAFPDDCGDLVAKFNEAAVKAIVDAPSAELTLTGLTKDGEPFAGSDTVNVIVSPKPATAPKGK